MGGVGKTLLTAAVVREERIRAAFKLIGWVNLSQQPDLLRLQQRLYEQLNNNESIPAKDAASVERQVEVLRRVSEGKAILIILDGAL